MHEMRESIPDSPVLAILYCPGCEPDRDPIEEILDIRWCRSHIPTAKGLDDDSLSPTSVLSVNEEAGGKDNRRWCELFRPKKTSKKTGAGRVKQV